MSSIPGKNLDKIPRQASIKTPKLRQKRHSKMPLYSKLRVYVRTRPAYTTHGRYSISKWIDFAVFTAIGAIDICLFFENLVELFI